ncbi:MAG: hypothetical protein IPK83_06740 [Planctomycetes bacterium]|nr:hypothetical protein [Planctomycetota bacterium]
MDARHFHWQFRTIVISLIFLNGIALAGLKPGDDVKVITVTGEAAGTDLNAMEQAKQDALRKAVEQACGTFISSHTKTKNYQAVYDKIMSLAAGFVTEYDVLERTKDDEISRCKIRATVSTMSFEKESALLLHTLEAEGNPRCVVVVVEDNNVDDEMPPKTDAVAQSALERFFIEKGVQLMDQSGSAQSKDRDIALAAINDDVKKLAAMAASFKADVVIRGVADARMAGTSEIGGRTLFKWSATITIRAYHTDSAQMLMSGVYSETKATTNENQGGDEAIRACAEKNAGKILKDLGEAWRKDKTFEGRFNSPLRIARGRISSSLRRRCPMNGACRRCACANSSTGCARSRSTGNMISNGWRRASSSSMQTARPMKSPNRRMTESAPVL